MTPRKSLAFLLVAAAAALPAFIVRFAHITLPPTEMALISGAAILGASFLLLWACDAAQADISQGLALAIVALVAVLPEYAVDMYFTWMAGQHPAGPYANYAIANMTGANRMLIGVAWAAVAIVFWFKTRQPVQLEDDRRLELRFLGGASLYALTIPIRGNLNWLDGLVFLGLYVWYIVLAARRPCEECEAEGPAAAIQALPPAQRRLSTTGLFLYSAMVIALNAGPFSEGLIGAGKAFGINEFLLVQWLAPIASEAPEFIVAISFAIRGQAGLALGSLISAKLNQWTLLVGMIPGVFAVSHGSLAHPIPMNSMQMHEILLTAAQSLLGIILLATLRLSVWHALLLFGLFAGQFVAPGIIRSFPNLFPAGLTGDRIHQVFSLLYVAAGLAVLADSPERIKMLWKGISPGQDPQAPPGMRSRLCIDCPHRLAAFRRRK